jgi:NitT/TauT family transport system permease protein
MAGGARVNIKSSVRKFLAKLLYFAVFLGLWQFAVSALEIKIFVLPGPIDVASHLFSASYDWGKHISATAVEVVMGFVITTTAGITLAILISWSKMFAQLLMPIIVLFNSLPKIAVAPLFLLWFGYGLLPNILIAFLAAFFPVVINSVTGLNALDEDLLDLVRYLHASKLQVFVKIRIPNSLPYIFAGVKISATMCVVGAIVGEFLASEKGLGYQLKDAQAFIDTPTMFACLFLLSLMGLVFFSCIQFIEKICLPWNAKKESR